MSSTIKHFRYSYRLLEPYTANHPLLHTICRLPSSVLEAIDVYDWYGTVTESSPVDVEEYHHPSAEEVFKPPDRTNAMNKYLLDNMLPSGYEPGFHPGRRVHAEEPFLRRLPTEKWEQWAEAAKAAAQSTVSMRVNQVLLDGNHRTSILMLFESILDEGWALRCEPFDVYVVISNRKGTPWEDVVDRLTKLIKRSLVRRTLSIDQRKHVAEEVKNIPVISAVLETIFGLSQSRDVPLKARREQHRAIVRQSPKIRVWFNELYPNQLLK